LILSAAIALFVGQAQAQEQPEESDSTEATDPLAPHRVKFDVLAERAIGTASKPVEFNWRRTTVQLAATGSFLSELNNFNSLRGGGMVRFPTGGMLIEVEGSYAAAWDTPASNLLALTPYRQPGRPNRMELDFTVAYPLAEGVVTTAPRFFPAVQMVFNAYASFRYILYPTGFRGLRPGEVARAILSPNLSQDEIDNLDGNRLNSMQVDLGRYGLMLGLGNDVYFKQGLFLSPRILVAVPVLAPATQTDLLIWTDLSLAIGVAL